MKFGTKLIHAGIYKCKNINDSDFLTNIVIGEDIKSSELKSITQKIARKITGMKLGLALGGIDALLIHRMSRFVHRAEQGLGQIVGFDPGGDSHITH